ncbi:MAG: hypothetical protein WD801_16210 [Gemmatimonadaceae bacterium]
MTIPRARYLALTPALAALLLGCAQAYLDPVLHLRLAPALERRSDSLKVHMRSGDLYILGQWSVADSGRQIRGSGTHYDPWRVAQRADSAVIATEAVALFETNSKELAYALGLQGIGVMATLGAWVSAVCLMDPKSCFGSCPTFYVEGGDTTRVHAEGFSESVARVLEARDVDALGDVPIIDRRLAIRMRNEAYETHMVRRVNVLAVARPPGGRIFASGDSLFYPATSLTPPTTCMASGADCLRAVAAHDGIERFSLTDSSDLAARETIHLTFRGGATRPGLVLTARNSLVSTFLFYQTLAYLGTKAGDALASMERGTRGAAEAHFGMAQLLGGVEVQIRDSAGAWRTVGTYQEAGPIASDTKVISLPALPDDSETIEVRLRMARGNWRIDWLALADLGDPVRATRVAPTSVERLGGVGGGGVLTRALSRRSRIRPPIS